MNLKIKFLYKVLNLILIFITILTLIESNKEKNSIINNKIYLNNQSNNLIKVGYFLKKSKNEINNELESYQSLFLKLINENKNYFLKYDIDIGFVFNLIKLFLKFF